jgi:DNA-binding Lrp family transcriptional regulator
MTLAFVFVECARGLASSAEQAIRQVQGVLEAHKIKSGTDYDLIVKVRTNDEKQFKTAISTLKSIAGIAAIAVSIVYGNAQ